jgi:hypothetical protein
MATVRERARPAPGYDTDFYSWALEQAALLRARRFAALDLEHLAEEVEDLAKAQARELRSRYETLTLHLLKWLVQPGQRSWGWVGTIRRERLLIAEHLDENPGLKPRRAELFDRAYGAARAGAAAETGLPEERFPGACPFTLEQAMDEGFWPGEPWAGWAEGGAGRD